LLLLLLLLLLLCLLLLWRGATAHVGIPCIPHLRSHTSMMHMQSVLADVVPLMLSTALHKRCM
jgi:hypothetical protein